MSNGRKPKEALFPGIQPFLFESPLYAKFRLSPQWSELGAIYVEDGGFNIDGHCVYCGKSSTFSLAHAHPTYNPVQWSQPALRTKIIESDLMVRCARSLGHTIRFYLWNDAGLVEKIGQFPSFADIANDESKAYRGVLSAEDSAELHRAIGLAAHGVGIGAFVYVRRIFERLIWKRFEAHQEEKRWDGDEFVKKRMDERIEFLQDYLPRFVVQNSKLYSILSLGIHELTEEQCAAFFEVAKSSIVIMLKEDQREAEERAERMRLERLIRQYTKPEDKE